MLDRQNILKAAADRGFDLCGVVPCRHLAENEARFRNWLSCGYQSSLGYLERNTEKRFDPRLLVESARTAVVCAVAYKNRASGGYAPECRTKVASYAAACDYHTTLRGMLHGLLEELRGANPDLRGRVFVDTAPLAEKQLAVEEIGRVWGGSAASRCSSPRNTAPSSCWASCFWTRKPTATTPPLPGLAAGRAAAASRHAPREPFCPTA